MYKKIRAWPLLLVLGSMALAARAQDSASRKPVEMADGLRANGKIYVVIAVLVTIFLGFIAYVIRLDRKIGRLEKDSK
ncbi:MAG TPA: CcmD family protein [Puia sp.]|nr:CcmD family protein [Puia sp.]